jgi:hypothetical protein
VANFLGVIKYSKIIQKLQLSHSKLMTTHKKFFQILVISSLGNILGWIDFFQKTSFVFVLVPSKNQISSNRHIKTASTRLKKINLQMCGNDTFACEIHMHACRFFKYFC